MAKKHSKVEAAQNKCKLGCLKHKQVEKTQGAEESCASDKIFLQTPWLPRS